MSMQEAQAEVEARMRKVWEANVQAAWQVYYTEDEGYQYWYNDLTGESQWESPFDGATAQEVGEYYSHKGTHTGDYYTSSSGSAGAEAETGAGTKDVNSLAAAEQVQSASFALSSVVNDMQPEKWQAGRAGEAVGEDHDGTRDQTPDQAHQYTGPVVHSGSSLGESLAHQETLPPHQVAAASNASMDGSVLGSQDSSGSLTDPMSSTAQQDDHENSHHDTKRQQQQPSVPPPSQMLPQRQGQPHSVAGHPLQHPQGGSTDPDSFPDQASDQTSPLWEETNAPSPAAMARALAVGIPAPGSSSAAPTQQLQAHTSSSSNAATADTTVAAGRPEDEDGYQSTPFSNLDPSYAQEEFAATGSHQIDASAEAEAEPTRGNIAHTEPRQQPQPQQQQQQQEYHMAAAVAATVATAQQGQQDQQYYQQQHYAQSNTFQTFAQQQLPQHAAQNDAGSAAFKHGEAQSHNSFNAGQADQYQPQHHLHQTYHHHHHQRPDEDFHGSTMPAQPPSPQQQPKQQLHQQPTLHAADSKPAAHAENSARTEAEQQAMHLRVWGRFFENAMVAASRNRARPAPQSESDSSSSISDTSLLREQRPRSRYNHATGMSYSEMQPSRALRRKYANWPTPLDDLEYERFIMSIEQYPNIDPELLSAGIFAATLACDTARIEGLVLRGANPSCVDSCARTPLHLAAYAGDHAVAVTLVAYDADVEAGDCEGNTPLHVAITQGHPAVATYLLESASPVLTQNNAGNTPLHLAAWHGQIQCVEKLLEYGGMNDIKNRRGDSPLGYALSRCQRPEGVSACIVILQEYARNERAREQQEAEDEERRRREALERERFVYESMQRDREREQERQRARSSRGSAAAVAAVASTDAQGYDDEWPANRSPPVASRVQAKRKEKKHKRDASSRPREDPYDHLPDHLRDIYGRRLAYDDDDEADQSGEDTTGDDDDDEDEDGGDSYGNDNMGGRRGSSRRRHRRRSQGRGRRSRSSSRSDGASGESSRRPSQGESNSAVWGVANNVAKFAWGLVFGEGDRDDLDDEDSDGGDADILDARSSPPRGGPYQNGYGGVGRKGGGGSRARRSSRHHHRSGTGKQHASSISATAAGSPSRSKLNVGLSYMAPQEPWLEEELERYRTAEKRAHRRSTGGGRRSHRDSKSSAPDGDGVVVVDDDDDDYEGYASGRASPRYREFQPRRPPPIDSRPVVSASDSSSPDQHSSGRSTGRGSSSRSTTRSTGRGVHSGNSNGGSRRPSHNDFV